MAALVSVFFSGLLLAIGLAVSGMTDANKVIDFLNIAGNWDPTLAFVMGGAVTVHFVLFRLIAKRKAPLFERAFSMPTRSDLDRGLITGSALFGVGWGLGGFCPGPGLVSLASFGTEALGFVGAMLAGMWVFHVVGAK